MTAGRPGTVVIGLGNPYRRDDGVGGAVAAAIADMALPNVVVVTSIADPVGLVEAWSGAALAIVIDAAVATPAAPGRVRRCALADLGADHRPRRGAGREGLSSHSVDVAAAYELARALGRAPDELVLLAIEAADTGHGVGLTPRVSRAVPEAVRLALAAIAGHHPETT
ncbi:MAG: hydrogenase maturation protease [Mycobacterium sp.]